MTRSPITFEDGAAYDRGMGAWSRLAGAEFLDWLALPAGLRWLDVGCGSGAFTDLVMQRCKPAEAQGIDPSEAQLAFARQHVAPRGATFQQGNAMALPFDSNHFDAAAMALVIFFVPDPAKGVAEMQRVVRPGGTVAAYAWDMQSGGFPFAPIQQELRDMGTNFPLPPSIDAARSEVLHTLWTEAGFQAIEQHTITVQRTFAGFDEFWGASTITGSIRPAIAAMAPAEIEQLKSRLRARLPADAQGRISYSASANAIRGRVPNT